MVGLHRAEWEAVLLEGRWWRSVGYATECVGGDGRRGLRHAVLVPHGDYGAIVGGSTDRALALLIE